MIAFFKHKKFWLPIIMLMATSIVLELFFRTGFYNRFLNPYSLMGGTYNQISAVKRFGINNVNWITIGDSKTDWGIDHGAIKKTQKKNNIDHIKFSIAGSNFMTLQSSAEWSINHFKNLDGILLGMYEYEFVHYSNPKEEFKTTWAFKNFWDFQSLDYFVESSFNTDFVQKTALINYLPDLQDFLKNPFKRFRVIDHADKRWKDFFNLNKNLSRDLCEFDIKDLPSCVATAKKLKGKTVPRGIRSVVRQCSTQSSQKRIKDQQWLTKPIDLDAHYRNWASLFDSILIQDKKLTLLLLPENKYFEYMVKPSNAQLLVDKLILKYTNNKGFNVIDLRDLFKNNNECTYYIDTVHFNLKGAQKITHAIINKLH